MTPDEIEKAAKEYANKCGDFDNPEGWGAFKAGFALAQEKMSGEIEELVQMVESTMIFDPEADRKLRDNTKQALEKYRRKG